jgi:hypothetical protein
MEEMYRRVFAVTAAISFMFVQAAHAIEVWRSTFDVAGGFDGMVEFQDGNPAKTMFAATGAAGGRLGVHVIDGITFGGQHDKGGRSLHTSREALGTLMRHRKTGSNYEANLGAVFGGVGISYHGYKPGGGFINLGPDAVGKEFQLVIGYDAPSRVIHIELFDINGVSLGSNIGDLDSDFGSLSTYDSPGIPGGAAETLTAEIDATRLKYLGWQDYIWNSNQQGVVWNVDTVAYFDTATGAFGAVQGGGSPGACCQASGTCAEGVTSLACTLAGGTWQGANSTCAGISCPPPPTSACCLPDDTCSSSLTTASACQSAGGEWRGPCATCATTTCGADGQMWRQTFDSDRGCLRDILNQVSAKQMIGPAAGGRVQITTWDNSTDAYTPDKAGAPVGTTLDSGDSFSTIIRFNWSSLNTLETQAFEGVGYLGSLSPQTRSICGALLRHWFVEGNYYVAADVVFGSVGYSDFLRQDGPSVSLGSNPLGQDFQLAIGFCGPTAMLRVGLYDAAGAQLTLNEAVITQLPSSVGRQQLELENLAVDHIGWEDYTANGGDVPTVWQVDSIAHYNTALGAFNAVEGGTPLPLSGACCIPDGTCTEVADEAACTTAGGTFRGLCSTCATAACPVVCNDPFADADADGDVDADDFGAFQRCFTGSGGTVVTGCRCFDRPEGGSPDGDVDEDDYDRFTACQSGAAVPADPQCDD